MFNPLDDALEALIPPVQGSPDTEVTSQQRWEHRVVKTLLGHFGKTEFAAAMVREAKAKTGVQGLLFELFKQRFPTFPMWLACRKIPYVHETLVGELFNFKKFKKSVLFKAFEAAESDAPEPFCNGRFGLVFEWVHVCPMLIIHNDYHELRTNDGVFFHKFFGTDPPQLFAVQSFESYLHSLPWIPE